MDYLIQTQPYLIKIDKKNFNLQLIDLNQLYKTEIILKQQKNKIGLIREQLCGKAVKWLWKTVEELGRNTTAGNRLPGEETVCAGSDDCFSPAEGRRSNRRL